jgi:hypothetical protein
MASKKGLLKGIGILLLGIFIGAVLIGGFVTYQWSVFYRNWTYLRIFEEIHIASMVRAGREKEWLKNVELILPQWVIDANAIRGNSKVRQESLWAVQRYYEKYDINVPAEIQPILKNLPPRPLTFCEIKKVQDVNAEPNNIEGN